MKNYWSQLFIMATCILGLANCSNETDFPETEVQNQTIVPEARAIRDHYVVQPFLIDHSLNGYWDETISTYDYQDYPYIVDPSGDVFVLVDITNRSGMTQTVPLSEIYVESYGFSGAYLNQRTTWYNEITRQPITSVDLNLNGTTRVIFKWNIVDANVPVGTKLKKFLNLRMYNSGKWEYITWNEVTIWTAYIRR